MKKRNIALGIIGGIIVIGVIGAALGEDTTPTTTEVKTSTTATQPKPPAKPAKPVNSPKISKAEFDRIKNGMTYKEVTKIIGGTGEVMSEVGSAGEQFHTVVYQYEGEGTLGANANMTFQDGKLQVKAQFGLE